MKRTMRTRGIKKDYVKMTNYNESPISRSQKTDDSDSDIDLATRLQALKDAMEAGPSNIETVQISDSEESTISDYIRRIDAQYEKDEAASEMLNYYHSNIKEEKQTDSDSQPEEEQNNHLPFTISDTESEKTHTTTILKKSNKNSKMTQSTSNDEIQHKFKKIKKENDESTSHSRFDNAHHKHEMRLSQKKENQKHDSQSTIFTSTPHDSKKCYKRKNIITSNSDDEANQKFERMKEEIKRLQSALETQEALFKHQKMQKPRHDSTSSSDGATEHKSKGNHKYKDLLESDSSNNAHHEVKDMKKKNKHFKSESGTKAFNKHEKIQKQRRESTSSSDAPAQSDSNDSKIKENKKHRKQFLSNSNSEKTPPKHKKPQRKASTSDDELLKELNETHTLTSRDLVQGKRYRLLSLQIKEENGFTGTYKKAVAQFEDKKKKTITVALPKPVSLLSQSTIDKLNERVNTEKQPYYTVNKISSRNRADGKGSYDVVDYRWS